MLHEFQNKPDDRPGVYKATLNTGRVLEYINCLGRDEILYLSAICGETVVKIERQESIH